MHQRQAKGVSEYVVSTHSYMRQGDREIERERTYLDNYIYSKSYSK